MKTSVEQLACLKERLFDAAVMVNVLYAVDDPLACLRGVHRLLKPGGILGLSTTHRETDLNPLLNSIEAELRSQPDFDQLADDLNNVRKINRMLENSVVRRHPREKYLEWIELAGFEVMEMVPSTYCDAVMLVHARRPKESPARESRNRSRASGPSPECALRNELSTVHVNGLVRSGRSRRPGFRRNVKFATIWRLNP